jgi:predicted CoA-binding protein
LDGAGAAGVRQTLPSSSLLTGHIDILDVFRKPSDLAGHLDDILAAKDRIGAVWLQSGITDSVFEEAIARAGVRVVSDHCLKVEHAAAAAAAAAAAGASSKM